MTGHILAGVDPLVAARYQIVVMCMLFGAGGLVAARNLALQRERLPVRTDQDMETGFDLPANDS